MKQQNNQKEQKEQFFVKTSASLVVTLIACLVVFALSIAGMIASFNALVTQHDKRLSADICKLMTEKMNSSIRYMTDSAQNMASVLSAQNFGSPQSVYKELSGIRGGSYVSIGFLDENGNLYASEQEKLEFEKWDLYAVADLADPVSISSPYRSGLTGQLVFSMFTDFYYDDGKHGWLFLTYPLSEIQKIASSESFEDETEIWLMHPKSSNIIQCAGSNEYTIGSWANAFLVMSDINGVDKPAYNRWLQAMLNGEATAEVGYNIKDTAYTQISSVISHMPGWYVVVRIPRSALSATMSRFRNYVLIFITVLLAVTVLLIMIMYAQGVREKKMLEQLSIHDPLTQVMNRRAFDYAAEQRLSRSKEAMLLFFDVDYFKQVNDRFGHDAGDRILVAFTNILKTHFTDLGFVSRYGGDEFVVLLDTADKKEVSMLLETMKKDVYKVKPTDDDKKNGDFRLSFSAGGACYPEDAEDLERLKHYADLALYDVKKRGRNGYSWYHPRLDSLDIKKKEQ